MTKLTSLKVAARWLLLIVAIMALVACAAPQTDTAAPAADDTAADAGAEAAAEGGTIVVGEWQEPKGLIWPIFYEAHTSAIVDSMFYKPIALDANDELTPQMLAEIPTIENGGISEDGTVITLNFREGFSWHDGQPVTSEDFAFTWQFIMDPATAAQTTAGWNKIASVETPDATTAIVTLEEPYVPFVPTTLTFPILPKHALEGVADPGSSDYARAPVGNGPFRFVEWVPGDRLVVEANPDAPTPPKLDEIIFKFVPDLNSMVALVRTGDIDVAWDYRETQIPELEKMESVEAVLIPGLAIERYYFNLRNPENLDEPHPIFNDLNVRRAVAMGMDRFTAVEGVLQGYGQVAVTELDNSPWFNEALEPIPYDPESAAQMLEEAGWIDEDGDGIREKDGVRLSFRHSTTSGNQVRENLQVLFQQNLADIGVELVIDNYPSATLFGGCGDNGVFGTSDFDMMGFTNQPVSIDLAQEWSDFFLSSSIKDCETNPAGTNSWGYNSPEADAALSCAVNELDPEARLECIMDAQQILYDDMIALYVYDRVDVYSVSDRVGGVAPTVFGGHSWNYADWYVNE
jgi:peptide/nickel transport system substrate-binding protein